MKFTAIRENHLYQKAYSKGKRVTTSAIAVYVLPDWARERIRRAHPLKIMVNRIGLTVSKKLGGSVVRSRTRRILREAYRMLDQQYGIKTGFLVVLAARQDATTMKSTEIAEHLYTALSKLDMLKRR